MSNFWYSNTKNVNAKHLHNPIQFLQGRVTGLHISNPGSDPNGLFDVRIRGLTTLLSKEQPLYVLDGVAGVPLTSVDPEDIQAIELIKDGSTARWGLRGAGGVIRIKTKRPVAASPSIRFHSYLSLEQPGRSYDVLDAAGYLQKQEHIFGSYQRPSPQDNNWIDIITRAAFSTVSNLSVTGGTNTLNYRTSLNWRNTEGIALHTGYERINGRIQLQSNLLENQLNLGLNLAGTSDQSKIGFRDAFKYAITFNPTAPRKTDDPQFGGYYQQRKFDYYNPLAILEQNQHEGEDQLLIGSLTANYRFDSLVEGLSAQLLLSGTREDLFRGEFYPAESWYRGEEANGFARTQSDDKTNRMADLHFNWEGSIATNLELDADIGYTVQNLSHKYRLKTAESIPDAESYTVIENNGISGLVGEEDVVDEEHLLSAFYGRAKLNIEGWFVESGLRYEGSSYLGSNNKWGIFPFLRTGFNIDSVLNIGFAESLTLRAGYGVAGNVPTRSGWSKDIYQPNGYYYKDGEYLPTYTQSQAGNPDLKWESTVMWNGGFDFMAEGGRLQSSLDLFHHNSTDLMINAELPMPPYPAERGYLNMGEITNKGVEIALQYEAIRKVEMSYTTGLNYSTIKTIYRSLSNDIYSLDGEIRGHPSGACGCSIYFFRLEEGKPAGEIHGPVFDGIDGDGKWILRQSDDLIDWPNIGNGLPASMLGWSHNVQYRNWNVGLLLRGVFGHDLVSETRLAYENNNLGLYNILESSPENLEDLNTWSSYYVEDGDYLKLDNLTITYHIPLDESAKIERIQLFAAVDDLFTITGYSGIDPSARLVDRGQFFLSDGSLPRPQKTDVMTPGIDRSSTWLDSSTFLIGVDIRI